MPSKLLIATHNPGKVREYEALLADLPLQITWLDAEHIDLEVAETGATFTENAILKATTYARHSGLLTWADDSGLEVDALDGWPGIASARHAGPHATDAERTAILLQKLVDVPFAKRTAVFRCVVALAAPDGRAWTAAGSSRGVILEAARGKGGFGYDPVFWVPELERSFAEISPTEKHAISHRGHAAKRARKILRQLLADGGALNDAADPKSR